MNLNLSRRPAWGTIVRMAEPKRVKLADLKASERQIAQDAADGIQTIVEDENGKAVMVVGTSKERRFSMDDELKDDEWLEKVLAEDPDDSDDPVPESDWFS